jgi:hypothetical protein
MEQPLLKYACTVSGGRISYRGLSIEASPQLQQIAALLNGQRQRSDIAAASGLAPEEIDAALERLDQSRMLLAGEEVLRSDGLFSGREVFWRLEALLLKWRKASAADPAAPRLDRDVALGTAPLRVVQGFCLEQGHLLRAVPEELALAVASATDEFIRLEYMDFYEEESRHGEMLLEPLVGWLGSEADIRSAPPLPCTIGLMQTYRNWARKDPLLYAVALMRDEGSPLDALAPHDIYDGMRRHYDIPKAVVDRFEWHANLDRENDHGFFPERIFRHVPVIEEQRIERLISALRQIIDLHDAFRAGVLDYYSRHTVESRCAAPARELQAWKLGRSLPAHALETA